MQIGILWYVLAGFVLGFTVSTLWEWLYYRGQRLRWRADVGASVGRNEVDNSAGVWREQTIDTATAYQSASEPMPWETPAYRSSGVFLESEKEPVTQTIPNNHQFTTASSSVRQPSPTTPAGVLAQPEHNKQNAAAPQPTSMSAERVWTPNRTDETEQAVSDGAPPVQGIPLSEPPVQVDCQNSTANLALASAEVTRASKPAHESCAPPSPPLVKPEAPAAAVAPSIVPPLARSTGHPDDLTKIQGIGEAYKHRLYAAHIYTWQQVANSDVETLRSLTKAKPNARPDDWKMQAQELATTFNRLDAVYEGPVPDDLSRVDGIGPAYADVLYRAGICTYEQLAAASSAELTVILPTPAIGNEFNFASWLRQATQLANAKQKNSNLLR